jgi:hypothetical protein
VYNIQKAVSRLDYAPKLNEIQVTDFQKGLGNFTPQPNKPVSFAALKAALKKAGYTLDAAEITVSGKLSKEGDGWFLAVEESGQRFALTGPNVDQTLDGLKVGDAIEIKGEWMTVGTGTTVHEVIVPTPVKRATLPDSTAFFNKAAFIEPLPSSTRPAVYIPATAAKPAAPIRVTSPGLTVYKGGAVTPRVYLIKQHLGSLEVNRQVLDLSVSYTPSPRVQLEIEAPLSRTEYDDNINSGSGTGLGNVTAWAKYRFFRKVKTYGDRQAAFRVGLELPTGDTSEPTQAQINVPEFVRQQLTPISGGLSPHFDLAFSQAGGRFIFGGNAEAVFRTERDGFRMGHEQRVSTDLEYVLPRDPHKPGGELFLILETTFVNRNAGRLASLEVPGSRSTEYFLAPGLQYAAHPRFVIEGSYQFPVVQNTGPSVLRTDRNLLLGVRILF